MTLYQTLVIATVGLDNDLLSPVTNYDLSKKEDVMFSFIILTVLFLNQHKLLDHEDLLHPGRSTLRYT